MSVDHRRRRLLRAGALGAAAAALAGCGLLLGEDEAVSSVGVDVGALGFRMPAEEAPHAATWMCFPGRSDVWDIDLPDVQRTIAEIGLTIAAFEPVRMLVRPSDRDRAADLVGADIELIDAPVDDLWARDTLPLFLTSDDGRLAAARVRFNGWGGKQVHTGDETLAALVADVVGVDLYDSGLVGEGGGLETDGDGTLLAARSSWVIDNRNPGLDEATIGEALAATLGADRVLWVDGIAGADITDGHIDTLARFTEPGVILHEFPAFSEPGELWSDVADRTAEELAELRTLDGDPYELVALTQPTSVRRSNPEFLPSYVNYYLCNGAVVMTSFGDDDADRLAQEQIGARYPDREIVALDTDPVAAGGGGIHCATQQQPAV